MAGLIVVIWHFVNGRPIISINRGAPASNEPEASSAEFTKAIEPDGAAPHKVLIIGPINCPKPAGVRCTELAAALASAGEGDMDAAHPATAGRAGLEAPPPACVRR